MSQPATAAEKAAVRERVWSELRRVARPDSRFHWNFAEFIPDFEGSERCADTVRAMDWYRASDLIFITPDNCLVRLRQYALEDRKQLVVSTYGIARGFMIMRPGDVPAGDERFAATLDGMEEFGRPIDLDEMRELGPFGLLVTGAAVITTTGIRWGKGHGYFDLEWAMFRDIGAVDETTPVVAVVHDCQVSSLALVPSSYDTIVDRVVTPSGGRDIPRVHAKPQGIEWYHLPADLREQIPPLQMLYERRPG